MREALSAFVILNPWTTLRVNSVKNLVPQHSNTSFLYVNIVL
jgi:hypothetical protein